MRLFVVIFIISIIYSCTEKSKTYYVQEQDIKLEQPRVNASRKIIDSSITISAELKMEGVAIFYTSDGTDPSKKSKKYNSPIVVNQEGVYKFKAFHPGYQSSDITEMKLYQKGVLPSYLKWKTVANLAYTGLGDSTLINHKKASLSFKDKQWVGFDTIAKAEVSFTTPRHLKSLTIGYLIDTKSWIFPPESVALILNKLDTLKIQVNTLKQREMVVFKDVIVPLNRDITSIDITIQNLRALPQWHPGKGLKAWLFMDEWIFNE